MGNNTSLESKRMFSALKRKMFRYESAKKRALKYMFDNDITDDTLASGIITIALLWAAVREGEEMSEDTLYMHLGIEADENTDNEILLVTDDDLLAMSFTEALDYTVENF